MVFFCVFAVCSCHSYVSEFNQFVQLERENGSETQEQEVRKEMKANVYYVGKMEQYERKWRIKWSDI